MNSDLYITDNFVRRAKKIHKGKPYDYSKVSCTKFNDKVTIICGVHGPFTQAAYSHIAGRGCRSCSKSLTQEEFSKRISSFNLKLVSNYLGTRQNVVFFCEKHGELEDVAENLLHDGCYRCKYPYRLIEDFMQVITEQYGVQRTFVYHNLSEPILSSTVLDVYCLNCKTYNHPTVQNHIRGKHGCRACWDGLRACRTD